MRCTPLAPSRTGRLGPARSPAPRRRQQAMAAPYAIEPCSGGASGLLSNPLISWLYHQFQWMANQ